MRATVGEAAVTADMALVSLIVRVSRVDSASWVSRTRKHETDLSGHLKACEEVGRRRVMRPRRQLLSVTGTKVTVQILERLTRRDEVRYVCYWAH